MGKKTKEQKKEKWPMKLLEEKYESEFEEIDGVMKHPEGLSFKQWQDKKGYVSDQIAYPENKRLTVLKKKANKLYRKMTRALRSAEEQHIIVHQSSKEYAKVLKEIEIEAQMPNFGDR